MTHIIDDYDAERAWPTELPDNLKDRLQRQVDTFAMIVEMRRAPPPARMKDDAKAIMKAANSLLGAVRKFSNEYGVTLYDNYRRQAVERLLTSGADLTEDELDRCRGGMDAFSLQWPLLGLMFYADELASTPAGKDGRRRSDLEKHAVAEIVRYFELSELEITPAADGLLFRTCKVFFARAGKPKKDDAIVKYLRADKAAKT